MVTPALAVAQAGGARSSDACRDTSWLCAAVLAQECSSPAPPPPAPSSAPAVQPAVGGSCSAPVCHGSRASDRRSDRISGGAIARVHSPFCSLPSVCGPLHSFSSEAAINSRPRLETTKADGLARTGAVGLTETLGGGDSREVCGVTCSWRARSMLAAVVPLLLLLLMLLCCCLPAKHTPAESVDSCLQAGRGETHMTALSVFG